MTLDEQLSRELENSNEEENKQREIELQKEIEKGDNFLLMKKTDGWKLVEAMILERSSSLSSRLLSVKEMHELYKLQGEILGIQSILNIVDSMIEASEDAKNILKGEQNDEQSESR